MCPFGDIRFFLIYSRHGVVRDRKTRFSRRYVIPLHKAMWRPQDYYGMRYDLVVDTVPAWTELVQQENTKFYDACLLLFRFMDCVDFFFLFSSNLFWIRVLISNLFKPMLVLNCMSIVNCRDIYNPYVKWQGKWVLY